MDKRVWRKAVCGGLALAAAAIAAMGGGRAVMAAAESEVERILVLDAGHGGFDGGASGAGGTTEQDINLSIARRAQALCGFFGVHTAMTRPDTQALDYDPSRTVRENKVADIRARAELVQALADPVFVSIHLNKFSDPQYHGAQVFYSANHEDGKRLAELMQAALISGCDPENHRQAKQAENSIYLMKKLSCPAVIVECGFLSNPAEEARLAEPSYQKKLAACIVYSYLQYEEGG